MINKHDHKRNKKTVEFKVGETVSVKISRIDKAGAAFGRLPGMICKIASHKQPFHTILTQWGILNDQYRAGDLEPFCGIVNVTLDDYENKYKHVSLTEAASLQGMGTGSKETVVKSCNCNGACKLDNRCKCLKNGVKCGSHCHLRSKAKNCKNCK